eukprot:UN02128
MTFGGINIIQLFLIMKKKSTIGEKLTHSESSLFACNC